MALSQSVQDALTDAQSSLRNALAYAARNERPVVCTSIAKIMAEIESIERYDQLFDSLENKEGGSDYGNFFGK